MAISRPFYMTTRQFSHSVVTSVARKLIACGRPDKRLELILSNGNPKHWDEFSKLLVQQYEDDLIYKQMYPDLQKRQEFMKHHFDYYCKAAFSRGRARLVYAEASDIISGESSMVGGITLFTDWNKNEKESQEMKNICNKGWDKYMRRKEWLNTYVFERMQNIIKSTGRTPMVSSCHVLLPGYSFTKGIVSSVGVDMLLQLYENENKLTQGKRIVFGVTDHLGVARIMRKNGWKITPIYRCDDGNNFTGLHSISLINGKSTKESLVYVTVYKLEDENLLNFIKQQSYDRERLLFPLDD